MFYDSFKFLKSEFYQTKNNNSVFIVQIRLGLCESILVQIQLKTIYKKSERQKFRKHRNCGRIS